MRIVGVITGSGERIVAGRDGNALIPLGSVRDFWTDPAGAIARSATVAERIAAAGAVIAHPVPDTARVLCIGLNYRAHAAEGSFDAPPYPMIFGRWTATLVPSGTPVPVPVDEAGMDWEGEIAAVIGRTAHNVDADTGRTAILGYGAFNDMTARRAQKLTAQWTLGKNADNSGPLGDIVTADEVGDLRDGLRVQTRVNGETMQDGNSRDMIFEIGDVIALVSRTMTLNPGDIIATGTPAGVGYVRTPPVLLGDGDVVEIEIERLGVLTTPVVATLGRT